MADQLWPGLLAEAWAALASAAGGAAPNSPDGQLPPGADPRLPAGLEVLWVSGAPGHLPSRLPVEDVAVACTGTALLACEERAGHTDPYRQVAALLHLIARRAG